MSQTRKNDQIGQIKIEDKVSEDVSITEQWFVDAKKSRLTRTEVGMFLSLRGLGSCDGSLTNCLYTNQQRRQRSRCWNKIYARELLSS